MATATETLRKIFRDIANAIRGKDGTTEADDKIHPENYASRIEAIETGFDTSDATVVASDILSGKVAYGAEGRIEGNLVPETGTDTSDATATAGDIAKDKTAYGPDGKITGTIPTYASGEQFLWYLAANLVPVYYNSHFLCDVDFSGPRLFKAGSKLTMGILDSSLGDSATSDVRSGKSFTSANGWKLSGTMPNAGAISGQLGSTSGATWSTSDPNRGSGKVSITGVNQTAGYTAGYSNGTLSVTVPANRLLKGRTITPGTSTIKVGSAEDILYGPINVAGDSNLITSNIRSGVSIFGVRGSLSDLSENFKATVTFRNNSSDNTVRIIGNKNNGNPFDITVSPGQSIVMDVWFVGILIIIQDKLRGFNLSGTFLPDASNPFVNISFGSPLRYITLIRLNVTSGSFEFL